MTTPPRNDVAATAVPPAAANQYPKNWLGIVAIIAPFTSSFIPGATIAAIIFGHMSLSAVKSGEANNRGLGLAGLILGYVFTGIAFVVVALYVGLFGWLIATCVGDPESLMCD